MFKRLIISLLLICILFFKAFPAVFVVTSNADSGPGTLRDALTLAAANGSTEKDYINFNLTDLSEAGRTIMLVNQLPDLSSNLVIDGSTQAGTPLGVSNAQVEISAPHNYNAITVFNGTGLNLVEFYGLYIHDFYDSLISYPDLQVHEGIKLTNCNNIIIGAPGKGNLVRGFNRNSLDMQSTEGLKIQSNVIGLSKTNFIGDDDKNYNDITTYTGSISISKCNDILLGGDNINEGNVIFTIVNIQFYENTTNNIAIKSNNFCVYQDGKSTEWYFEFYSGTILVSTIYSNDIQNFDQEVANEAIVNMDISNNVTGSQITMFAMQLLKGTINFTHNFFNVARDGYTDILVDSKLISSPQNPIVITDSNAQVNVGSNDPGQKNYLFNSGTGISIGNDPNVFVRFNDFRCTYNAYSNYSTDVTHPLPTISIKGANSNGNMTIANGIATPNSTIDIYSSETCSGICQIRSYLQTVTADNTGNWQANIQNLNGIFYVSATLNNQTSVFKTFEVNTDKEVLKNLRCGEASITGLQIPQGISCYWLDQSGNIVSTMPDLKTTKAGDYTLILGGGCISSKFTILDDRMSISDFGIKKTDPGCGQNSGSIQNLFAYDPENKINNIEWIDASNSVIGNEINIANLSPGSYTLKVFTSDGCEADYGPVTLKNTTGPNIDQSNVVIQSTNCGQSTGSITNINATGTGTLKYIWWNNNQQTVSTTQDLLNQPAGTYQLQVTDDTQCGPVYSTYLVIPETNGIMLDETKATVIQAH